MNVLQDKANLTAVVLTYNECLHIERCVSRLLDVVKEVVVIDSYSTDQTVELARSLGARVYQNPWTNHAVQFNWALDNVELNTDWVIRVDADEYLELGTTNLAVVLDKTPAEISGYTIKRKYVFLGKWIRHGTMYPVHTLRLFRTGKGRVENRWMDEHILIRDGRVGQLDVDIVDDNLNPVSWWVQKHNDYATKEMIETLDLTYRFLGYDSPADGQQDNRAGMKRMVKEKLYARLPVFVRPLLYFLYRYFLRLGFLDGSKGFAFHFMQGLWYRMLVDLKVMEAQSWIDQCKSHEKSDIKKVISAKTGLDL